jgi:hypothetical protein
MAYNKAEVLERALKAIDEHELTTQDEVWSHLALNVSTVYTDDEWKVEVLEPIKRAIEDKRVSLKARMKRDWRKSESNPTLQIAAFKLMANEEELSALNTSKVQQENTGKDGGPIQNEHKHVVEFRDYSNGDSSAVQ